VTLQELSIQGSYLATHNVFPDERGLFREWFKADEIATIDPEYKVRQANYSLSKKSVIRGIHYSLAPEGQAKLVTCASGSIVDVLIDLRVGSPTYLKIEYIELAEDSGKVAYIPTGVGHGFVVISDVASVVYLTSSEYAPEFERSICPTDPELAINWQLPLGQSGIISAADIGAPTLALATKSGELPAF
jgi:dTDP-4-dehydrorhamnose 3,5-epimerase